MKKHSVIKSKILNNKQRKVAVLEGREKNPQKHNQKKGIQDVSAKTLAVKINVAHRCGPQLSNQKKNISKRLFKYR